MALAQIYRVVQDLEGNVVTGVLGTVTLSGTSTLASLFADADGTLPLPNPTTNNAQYGSFALFVGAGTYTMQFVKAGYTFETQYNITMRDPAAGVNTITGTANRVLVSPVPGVGAVTLSTPQDLAPDSTLQFTHLGLGTPGNAAYGLDVATASRFTGTLNASAVAITGGTADVSTLNATTNIGVRTAAASIASVYIDHPKDSMHGIVLHATGTDTVLTSEIVFQNVAATAVGSITSTASATAYNTTSDARLKEFVQTLVGALDVIRALNPVSFHWQADGSKGNGFLAHELMKTIPEAVSGLPDEVNLDGTIKPQQVDHSKLVVFLVGAVQELLKRVEVLEELVTAP